MASLNELVSEVSHTLGRHNDYALRQHVRGLIIHIRNELIRHSVENHRYVDAGLQQTYRVALEPDDSSDAMKTAVAVPRPVRLTNNLPFMRVATAKGSSGKEIAYVKDSVSKFKKYLPGMTKCLTYDYIDDFVYVYGDNELGSIVIQAPFEIPQEVAEDNGKFEFEKDDDPFFLPEDMIGSIKEILFKRDLANYRTNIAANDNSQAITNR